MRFTYYPAGSVDPVVLSTVDIPSDSTGVMGSWTEVSGFAAFVFRVWLLLFSL